MKKILLNGLVVLLALCSCNKTDDYVPEKDNGKNEGTVTISIRSQGEGMSGKAAQTGATEDEESIANGTAEENNIESLRLLIFIDSKFAYDAHAAKQPSGYYQATLKASEKANLEVHFLANYSPELTLTAGETTVAQLQKMLSSSTKHWEAANRDKLPMWGVKKNLQVLEDKIENWGTVDLLRAVAGVDVYQKSALAEEVFKLEGVAIYYAASEGYIMPENGKYSETEGTVSGTSVPSTMATNIKTTFEDATKNTDGTFNMVADKFYIYENNKVSSKSESLQFTRVIVKGSYKGGASSYYPINFTKEVKDAEGVVTGAEYTDIMRNTKYIFEIESVWGDGYPDPDTAADSDPINMNTNIWDWDITHDTEAGYDGTFYISIANKNIELARNAEAYRLISASSNAPFQSLTAALQNADNGAVVPGKYYTTEPLVDEDGNPVLDENGMEQTQQVEHLIEGSFQNDHFRYQLIADETGKLLKAIKLWAVTSFDISENSKHNADKLKITVGNLQFEMSINQIDGSTADWDDGGNLNFGIGNEGATSGGVAN